MKDDATSLMSDKEPKILAVFSLLFLILVNNKFNNNYNFISEMGRHLTLEEG